MSDMTVTLDWTGSGMEFDGRGAREHVVRIDGDRASGVSPMEAMLLALGGCTAADIVDIVGKMRVGMEALHVRLEGDRAPEPPRRYTAIRLIYQVRGVAPADADKVRRAIALSEEKYCSVRHTLRADVELTSELELL